jgi:hypothetical protein
MRKNPPETVTASEIADLVFCPEAWRLAQVETQPTPAIQTARVEGTRHHGNLAVVETSATRSINRGRNLVALGVAALVLLAVLWAIFQ